MCIARGYVLADKRRPRDFTEEQCFKSQDGDGGAVRRSARALENSVEIAAAAR